jgi:membrane fusion protein, heavy metal efflux system
LTNGEVTYDPTLVARLSSRAAGTVWRVDKKVGDKVREGEVLALVDAAQVGQAKAELLQAVTKFDLATKTHKRLADSSPGTVVSAGRVQEAEAVRADAEASVRKAIQTLTNLGLPIAFDDIRRKSSDELTEHIQFLGLPTTVVSENGGRANANLVPITAPRDGVVVRRDVVTGEVIESSKVLLIVADTSRMWLMLDIPMEEAQYVEMGQRVLFRPNGDANEYAGEVTWISTEVDSHTRTVKVRAELPNERGRLRNEAFGAGKIILRNEPDATVVPKDAIHWEGCCFVTFVRDKDYLKDNSYKVFHTRMVRPGVTNGNVTEVIAGLLPGEVIVAKGSGVLRAELLKGNLGAG